MWDSDWQRGGDSYEIEYAGSPLSSRARYSWRLELADQVGNEMGAVTSWFEMGLLRPADFVGKWIHKPLTSDGGVDPPDDPEATMEVRKLGPVAYLRKEFRVTKPVVRARAYATARGLYELYLNGQRVGDHELAPGWTDYRNQIAYQCYDVTPFIREGNNAAGIILGEGWWSGFVGFDRRRQGYHYGDYPEAWGQIFLEHPDGSQTSLGTDNDWSFSHGPIVYSDLLMGEYVDSRRDLGEWAMPGYDNRQWRPVAVHEGDLDNLVATRDEPIRVVETLAPISVDRVGSAWIVDFGQNLSGRVRADFRGEAVGTRIKVRHAEVLDNSGSIYIDNLRTSQSTDFFVCSGSEVDLFEPKFTTHGFRYAEFTGLGRDLSPTQVKAVVVRNDIPWIGSFESSDQRVNQLESNIRWGQRGNFVAVPTDCPQRDERLGWLGDAQVFVTTAAYNASVSAFFARWLEDVRFGQTQEGAFADTAPNITTGTEGSPAWGDAGVIIPWKIYRMFGDKRLLAESFPSMRRWVDFVERNNPDLIWRRRVGNNYGDWLQIDAATPREVLATSYFAQSATLVARAARALGEIEAATHYSELANRILTKYQSEFVEADGRIAGDTQTAYALAIQFGLLPASRHAQLESHLVRKLDEHGGRLTTGFVGVSLLLPALSDLGRDDLAYSLLHEEGYPSWLYSVNHGATTMWERWDGWTVERGFQAPVMNSFNHYAFGAVGEWLYRYAAGIDQTDDSVAFEKLLVAPRVGGKLASASASYETPRGLVVSRWQRHGRDFDLALTVPPGTTAIVTVPSADGLVTEGGRPIRECEHISDVTPASSGVRFVTASGKFEFQSTLPEDLALGAH